jgi:hypothetical protein
MSCRPTTPASGISEEEAKTKGGKSGRVSRPVVDPFAKPAATPGTSKARATASGAEGDVASEAVSSAALLALAQQSTATSPETQDPKPGTPDPGSEPPKVEPKALPPPPPEPAAPAQVKLPGGIVISSVASADAPVVRATFFYWIVNQNISGVFQSPPHRIMLNGRLVQEGDVINRPMGVTFDRLDPANKVIVFRDKTGATVTRSY